MSRAFYKRSRNGGSRRTRLLVLPFFWAAALALAMFTAAPRRAWAVYECGGVQDTCNCGADNFCICCYWSGLSGNCVWYAWHKACCGWGIALEWCTNADTWDGHATNHGYPVNGEACVDTVFVCEANASECWSGSVGHVGWVNDVYPDGSIDVEEQGCYSWDGVQSRNFAAQNASPPMDYIYKPGTTCVDCDCDPGDTESDSCPQCGTRTRTCGSDCFWEPWSACTNQGPCEVGDTQSCGACGTQTCLAGCTWGTCNDPCDVDGAVPPPDAAVPPPDGAVIPSDSSVVNPDSGGLLPDATGSPADAGGPAPDAAPSEVGVSGFRGGCGCRAALGRRGVLEGRWGGSDGASSPGGVFLLLGLGLLGLWRRRRR